MKTIKQTIRKLINYFGYDILKVNPESLSSQLNYLPDLEDRNIKIVRLVKEKTLTSVERINGLIDATRYIIANNIEGSIVECGVWQGGSMMAVAYTLQELSNTDRDLYLFDTYEGMTSPTEEDIAHFSNVDAQTLLNSEDEKQREAYICYSDLEEVQKNLYSTKYPSNKIHFIKGKVEDTIPSNTPNKIALLRLDTDWYESTRHELEHLFPLLVSGGVIIIDDYGYWKGCKKATDEYIQNNQIPLLLNRLDSTGRIAIKVDFK